jgi:lantibiotic modifying enzyme
MELREKFFASISEWLELHYLKENNQMDERFLLENLEDLLLPTVVNDFYSKKYTSFEKYLISNDFLNIEQLNPNLRIICEGFISEILDSYSRYSFLNSNYTDLKILGDPHPIESLKFKISEKVLFKSSYPFELVFGNIIKKYFDDLTAIVPATSVKNSITTRDFITVSDSTVDESKVKDYYFNFGQIATLALFFRAIDLNAENIIINLPYPILFDLECVFTNDIGNEDQYNYKSTGLFKISDEFDMSAFSGGEKPLKSYLKPILEGKDDSPVIKWKAISKGRYFNIPQLDGNRVNPESYVNQVLDGMDCMYSKLKARRKKISIFLKSRKVSTRVILAPTKFYKILLQTYAFPPVHNSVSFAEYAKKELSQREPIHSINFSDVLINDEVRTLEKWLIPKYSSEIHSKNILNSSGEVVASFSNTQFDTWVEYIEGGNFDTSFDSMYSSFKSLKI